MRSRNSDASQEALYKKSLKKACDRLGPARKAVEEFLTDDAPHPVNDILKIKIAHIQEGADYTARTKRATHVVKKLGATLRREVAPCENLSDDDLKHLLYQIAFPAARLTAHELEEIQRGNFAQVLSILLSNSDRANLFLTEQQFKCIELNYVIGLTPAKGAEFLKIDSRVFNNSTAEARQSLGEFFARYNIPIEIFQATMGAVRDAANTSALISRFSTIQDAIAFYCEEHSPLSLRNKAILHAFLIEGVTSTVLAEKYGFAQPSGISTLYHGTVQRLTGFLDELGMPTDNVKDEFNTYLGGSRLKIYRSWTERFTDFLAVGTPAPPQLKCAPYIPVPVRAEIKEALHLDVLHIELDHIDEIAPTDVFGYGYGAIVKLKDGSTKTILLTNAANRTPIAELTPSLSQQRNLSENLYGELLKFLAGATPVDLSEALSDRKALKGKNTIKDMKLLPQSIHGRSLWEHQISLPSGYPFESIGLKLIQSTTSKTPTFKFALYEPGEKGEKFGTVTIFHHNDSQGRFERLVVECDWIERPWMPPHHEVQGRQLLAFLRNARTTPPGSIRIPIQNKVKKREGREKKIRYASLGQVELPLAEVSRDTEHIVITSFKNNGGNTRALLCHTASDPTRSLPYGFLEHSPSKTPQYRFTKVADAIQVSPILRTFIYARTGQIVSLYGVNDTLLDVVEKVLIPSDIDSWLGFLLNERYWNQWKGPTYEPRRLGELLAEMKDPIKVQLLATRRSYERDEIHQLFADPEKDHELTPSRILSTLLVYPEISSQLASSGLPTDTYSIPMAKAYALYPADLQKHLLTTHRGRIHNIASRLFPTILNSALLQ